MYKIMMKPNSTVQHRFVSFDKPNFIVVTNFEYYNEVYNWGLYNRPPKGHADIGIWHIKYKKQ